MRATRVLGYGLAAVLGSNAAAVGQFAVDRPSAPVTPAGGFQPAPAAPSASGFRPASYATPAPTFTPPAGGFTPQPAAAAPNAAPEVPEIPSKLAGHPLALKPEHGAYVICVRSYMRPEGGDGGATALQLADELANEIRTAHRTPALLFERITDERKAELIQKAAARQKLEPIRQTIEAQRQRAALNGMTFLEPDTKLKYKTVKHNDQFAVVIAGGFKTDKEARKYLETVRKWPMPANVTLLDKATIVGVADKTGRAKAESAHINPYGQAFVVANPTVARAAAATSGLDEFTIKLNEGRPYNLLKAKKDWTLAVKTFSAPTVIQGKDEETGGMRRFSNGTGEVLNASADQAESLAGMLRSLLKDPRSTVKADAYVLHSRAGSLVTVGEFDGPNDPALAETRRLITGLQFNTSDRQNVPGRPLTREEGLFGNNILPIPVPR